MAYPVTFLTEEDLQELLNEISKLKGKTIVSFEKTGSTETADIYTFTYADGTSDNIEIPYGKKGDPFTYEDFTEEQLSELISKIVIEVLKVLEPKTVSKTGAINVTVADNTLYNFTAVTSLVLNAAAVECHGFVTFGTGTPSVAIDADFTSSGDDINEAAAGEIWEFSVFPNNSKAFIIWKNWSDV